MSDREQNGEDQSGSSFKKPVHVFWYDEHGMKTTEEPSTEAQAQAKTDNSQADADKGKIQFTEPPFEESEQPIMSHYKLPKKQQQQEKDIKPIPNKLDDVIAKLEEDVGYKTSFDIVVREMTFGNKRTAFYFMNGFAKDTI